MSSSGRQPRRVAPACGKVRRFAVPAADGGADSLWYIPPGTPNPFLPFEIAMGSSMDFRSIDDGNGARRIHLNGFSRPGGQFYRAITYGRPGRGKEAVRLAAPTALYARTTGTGTNRFEQVGPYNLVPHGASYVFPSTRVYHKTPNCANERLVTGAGPGREILLTGLDVPLDVLHRMGQYRPRRGAPTNNGNENDDRCAPNRLQRRLAQTPPPHTFRGQSIRAYSKRRRSA